jgi:hypothetical protein
MTTARQGTCFSSEDGHSQEGVVGADTVTTQSLQVLVSLVAGACVDGVMARVVGLEELRWMTSLVRGGRPCPS